MTENLSKALSWFGRKWFSIRYRTNKYLPERLRSRDYHEELKVWRRDDPKKNANSTPPKNEKVDLRCVWVVEFYAPAHVDSLIENLEKLGWDRAGSPLADKSVAAWVRSIRESRYGGAWLNLGYITDKHKRPPFSRVQRAVLPPNIKHATGNMFSMTPSLICIVIGFVFEEEMSGQFDKTLRQDRQTDTVPSERGYTIFYPERLKAKEINRQRNSIKRLAFDWLKSNLPGIFCSGLLDADIPICEYSQLKSKKPFPQSSDFDREVDGYLAPLQFDSDFDAYEQTEHPSLKFRWPLLGESRNDFYSLLAGREVDFDKEEIKSWGGGDRSGQIAYVDNFMKGTVGLWALTALLKGYSRQQSGLRDSALLRAGTSKKALKILSELEKHVGSGVDIASVTTELIQFSDQRGLFFHEAQNFQPTRQDEHRDPQDSLIERIRLQVHDTASSLNRSEEALRSIVTQFGSLVGTKENLTLQRQIRALTLLIIALTIITLWPTLKEYGALQLLISFKNYAVEIIYKIGCAIQELLSWAGSIF